MVKRYPLQQVLDDTRLLPERYTTQPRIWFDPEILHSLSKLLAIYDPQAFDMSVYVTDDLALQTNGSSASPDHVENVIETYIPLLSDFTASPYLPLPVNRDPGVLGNTIVRALSQLEQFHKEHDASSTQLTIMSDALLTEDRCSVASLSNYSWFNTPISEKKESFDLWLASLTKKRRYKVRQLLQEPWSVRVSTIHNSKYLRNRFKRLADQWSGDIESLVGIRRQWLFAAAAAIHSRTVYLDALDSEKNPVASACFLLDPETNTAYLQGVCGPQDLGSFFLVHFMRLLHQPEEWLRLSDVLSAIKYVDPCCVNGFQDLGDPYFTYKRLVVNANLLKPLVYAGNSPTCFNVGPHKISAPYYHATGPEIGHWVLPESGEPAVLFDPC